MYYFDPDFFTTDSRERSYVLGFLMSDGYLSGNELGWYISSRDVEILNKIKQTMGCEHPIKLQTSKWGEYARLRIVNKSVADQLVSLGFWRGAKTGQEFVPEACRNSPYDFIRGVFDGDGTVGHKTPDNRWAICCSNSVFLEEIKDIIGCGSVFYSDLSRLTVYNRNHLNEIYDNLYKNTDLYLTRKYDIFTKIRNSEALCRRYTEDELSFISNNMNIMTKSAIAKKLNRSIQSIHNKIKQRKNKCDTIE